jgi:phosphate transport system permease protein
MAVDSKTPTTARARLAVSGARAATQSVFGAPSRGDKLGGVLFPALLFLALAFALGGLAALLIWSAVQGFPRLDLRLFTENPSRLNPETAGYRTALLGTVYVIATMVALVVPVGVGAAVYLEEYADKSRWHNRMIELNIQNLAGVPSIVFGILGLAFIVRGPLSLGFIALAGSITLALLVLPTVVLASREAIRAVPPTIPEGSLALGATQGQTISRQVLPAAFPGILTGVILAVARAIGEAAPLLLVGALTFVVRNPSLLEGSYSVLPVQIYNYASRPQPEYHVLAMAGVIVMLVVLLAMNSIAIWLRNRYERRW